MGRGSWLPIPRRRRPNLWRPAAEEGRAEVRDDLRELEDELVVVRDLDGGIPGRGALAPDAPRPVGGEAAAAVASDRDRGDEDVGPAAHSCLRASIARSRARWSSKAATTIGGASARRRTPQSARNWIATCRYSKPLGTMWATSSCCIA